MANDFDDLIGELVPEDPDGLCPKERRFVEYYTASNDKRAAAIQAGCSPEDAENEGRTMMWRPHVQRAIEISRAKREQRIAVTIENVTREYARIGFFDPRKLFSATGQPIPLHDLDDATAACIAGLDVQETIVNDAITTRVTKYKLVDKAKGLDAMAKMLGMFTERVELTGANGGPMQFEEISDNEKARRVAFVLMRAMKDAPHKTIDVTPKHV